MTDTRAREFQEAVRDHYRSYGRHGLPWRLPDADGRFDPYKIMVSELMLQQTQVARVIPKYHEFLERFPTVAALAAADLGDVLRAWNGLGYNRRAKYLRQAAAQIQEMPGGTFPQTVDELAKLPGIGKNTAGAIAAYAFNRPVVFIETNIRTVFIHHFFKGDTEVSDRQILGIAEQVMDRKHPREWYWALMDYGAHLKQTVGNLNHRSKGYAVQSRFEGSRRQVRGKIIRQLGEGPRTSSSLEKTIADKRVPGVIEELLAEGLIRRRDHRLSL